MSNDVFTTANWKSPCFLLFHSKDSSRLTGNCVFNYAQTTRSDFLQGTLNNTENINDDKDSILRPQWSIIKPVVRFPKQVDEEKNTKSPKTRREKMLTYGCRYQTFMKIRIIRAIGIKGKRELIHLMRGVYLGHITDQRNPYFVNFAG